MIIDLFDKTSELLEELKEVEQLERINYALDDLVHVSEDILSKSRSISTFLSITEDRLDQIRDQFKFSLPLTAEQIRDRKEEISNGDIQVNQLIGPQTLLRTTRENLDRAWFLYVQSQIGQLSGLIKIVNSIPRLSISKQTILKLEEHIRAYESNPPSSTEEMEKFEQKIVELRDALSEIQDLTPEVVSFLQRVIDNRATLEDIDNTVLEWLEETNLGVQFDIHVSNKA